METRNYLNPLPDQNSAPGVLLKRAWRAAGRPGSLKSFVRSLTPSDDPRGFASEWLTNKANN